MSQEYTEDKHVRLKKLSSGRRLLEVILLAICLSAIFLMVALMSFNPSDPSWSQTTWNAPVKNLGGSVGSWSADILFSAFGILAFAIPPLLLLGCWAIYHYESQRRYIDFFSLSLRLIGGLALILSSCGLAALNFDDLPNFASGGVIGSVFSNAIMPWFNSLGATLALLFLWSISFTLFTGWSWLTIAEKIGAAVLIPITLMTNRARGDDYDAYDVEETEDALQRAQEAERQAIDNVDSDDVLFSAPSISELAAVETEEVQPTEEAAPLAANQPIDEVEEPLAFSASEPQEAYHFEVPDDYQPVVYDRDFQFKTSEPQAQVAEPTGYQPESHNVSPENGVVNQPANHHTHERWGAEAQPAATTPTEHTDNPSLANLTGQQNVSMPASSISEAVSQASGRSVTDRLADPAALAAAGISVAALERHAQVKQNMEPELPRPNPVRLPTRRELYGIRIPSQRDAELQRRKEEALQREQIYQQWSAASENEPQQDEEQENRLREQFLQQQRERYGSDIEHHDETESPISHQAEVTPTPEKVVHYTQPEIEHRWSSAPASVEQTEQNTHHFSQSKNTFSAQDDDENAGYKVEPKFDLSEHISVLDEFSPVNDLVNEEPADPLFMPSFSATSVENTNNTPQVNEVTKHVAPTPDISANQSHTFAPLQQPQQQQQQPQQPQPQQPEPQQDSLFHPFLVRNDQPLPKPTTPMPSLDLLTTPPTQEEPVDMFKLEQTARLIEARLNDYRVKAEVVGFSPGPVITRFELDLAPGVKTARISTLSRDLARSLSTTAVRVVEVIPGKPYVGLELPNEKRQTVYLREVLDCDEFRHSASPLTMVLGKDIEGDPVIADLAKMPHLLVAGTTGSGKSVGVNAMILSILYKSKPEDVRFIMIDPKMLELSIYEGIPHLLTEVVTDMKDAANALRWCVNEMERRYRLMSALGVRNLAGYNDKIKAAEEMGRPIPDPHWKPSDSMETEHPMLKKEPYIVVMVDEFADLMMTAGKKVEELIARLAQKARAAGIHLVLATQRPSVDIITGLIKANIPTRIAFTVSSKIDSRTILDQGGAESLLGMGDMLYLPPNSSIPVRVHGAFVRDQEVHAVVNDWKARGRPEYIDSITKCSDENEGGGYDSAEEELDPLFDQAVEFVVEKQRVSISGVQRQFRIGYNRAARIVEQMETQGIVSEPRHNGNREVLSPRQANY